MTQKRPNSTAKQAHLQRARDVIYILQQRVPFPATTSLDK